MPEIYGAWADRRSNIVELGTLSAVGATAAVEVSGNSFTFVHDVTGTNVTTVDEGSLDGTHWFQLDTEKVHGATGIDASFYPNRIVRYVRSCVTAIDPGESVIITMACD